MNIVHVENRRHDHLTVNLSFRRGAMTDPPGRCGRAWLAGHMLLRGTRRLSEERFQEELDLLGSNLSVGIGPRAVHLVGDCRRETREAFLSLLGEALLHPSMLKKELDKICRNHIESIKTGLDSDHNVLHRMIPRLLFEGHPAGRPAAGESGELRRVTREDIRGFHRDHLGLDGLVLGAAGDLSREELEVLLRPLLDSLPGSSVPWDPAPLEDPPEKGLDVLLAERPGRTQAHVGIARRTAAATAPDLVPLVVFNTAFGDTFSAPLVREIRERRGWSYGVDSVLLPGRETGVHYMHYTPSNEDAAAAISLGLSLLDETVERGPDPGDLEFARSWLVNHFPFHFDTAARRLDLEIQMVLTGRTREYLDRFVERVRAVTPADAADAARRHLSARRVAVAVVGDPSLASSLGALPGVTRFRRVRFNHEGNLPV